MDELAAVRLCGFSLAFDRLAKSLALNFNAQSSNCMSELSCSLSSCSLLLKSVTNLFKPMRNSDPRVTMVLVEGLDSDIYFICTLKSNKL